MYTNKLYKKSLKNTKGITRIRISLSLSLSLSLCNLLQHWFYVPMSLSAQDRLLSQLPELCADGFSNSAFTWLLSY
jgi:hypothetical protein